MTAFCLQVRLYRHRRPGTTMGLFWRTLENFPGGSRRLKLREDVTGKPCNRQEDSTIHELSLIAPSPQ